MPTMMANFLCQFTMFDCFRRHNDWLKFVVFMFEKIVFCNDFKLLNANIDGQFSMSIYNVWIVVSEDILAESFYSVN